MKADSTVYRGARSKLGATVTVDCRVLSPATSLRLANHSPDGFEWGYLGSGPTQLALALLLDFTGDRDLAERCHQEFKWQVVAHWDGDLWTFTGKQLRTWLESREHLAQTLASEAS